MNFQQSNSLAGTGSSPSGAQRQTTRPLSDRVFFAALALLLAGGAALSACTNQAAAQQDALDRKFREMMTGVALVGRSSSLSSDKISTEEQYIIEKVTKLQGDTWLFEARFKYGHHDVPIPMPVQIKWAGDTPVICVTDFAVPNMGTYSARVVLHNGQYAGTWNGKGYGGQMFGKLVPIAKK